MITYRERLIGRGFDPAELDAVDAEIVTEIDAATEEAKGGAWPDLSRLYTNVWSDGGHAWRTEPRADQAAQQKEGLAP